ncbi:hypothetical protein F2P81_019329 [Scophthalmus maximus]|uniref:Rad21/Rec8-like protein N-terminal domain-containing protein n=1 Tax=Scophthalmus maximus TaxID=52904 RepID=A0A6A4SC88_SCOMX|nr:hypothetical protein F2P81_019329 [Scophthalmus maximus]
MFYYPNVLHRQSGCFSTIWLAATRGIRVTRRELLRVNVKRTCGDILSYVTAQVPPSQPNLPWPRFSLYLSSQLQYGVVVVYHSQCRFLLEEIQQTIDRLLRAKICTRIDMAESDRLVLNVPDSLNMMEEAEGAQDPFFGLMQSHQLLSPYKIHQFFEGEDLPEVTAREIDMLIGQPDQFDQGVCVFCVWTFITVYHKDCTKVEEQRTRERTRELEGAMSSFDQLNKTALGAERDSVYLLDEGLGQPVVVPLVAVALEMTPQHVAMPTPPSGASGTEGDQENIAIRPLRKPAGRRRRQLVFADPQVQMSDGALKDQIENPLTETLDLSEVLLDLPSSTKRATPAQLFNAPCGCLPHADLQLLWKQCALLTVLPAQGGKRSEEMEEGEEEAEGARGESEQEREILRTERRHSDMKQISTALDVILDISKEDKSGSELITPIGRWSPPEDTQPLMEPIAEENIEMPEAPTDTESRDMLSWISSNLQRFAGVTFDSLLPPEADRTTAAHTLYKLLELLSARQLTVRQTEPFSQMTISAAA